MKEGGAKWVRGGGVEVREGGFETEKGFYKDLNIDFLKIEVI